METEKTEVEIAEDLSYIIYNKITDELIKNGYFDGDDEE